MTDTTTAAIEALMKDVTPGPWWSHTDDDLVGEYVCTRPKKNRPYDNGELIASVFKENRRLGDKGTPNARFIAAARDLVPTLAAERDAAIRDRDNALALINALTEANDGLAHAACLATARALKAEIRLRRAHAALTSKGGER